MASPDVVVKIGGALLRDPGLHGRLLQRLSTHGPAARLLLVPGGGPFADVVRELDARLSLGDELAHWLAIRAMDLHAELIAHRMPETRLVDERETIDAALASGAPAVLAPFRWLRREDPLPHSWDVTSDSIAVWIAQTLGAPRLVLVKRVDGTLDQVADAHLARMHPTGLDIVVATPDTVADALRPVTR